jgi:aspartate racemase
MYKILGILGGMGPLATYTLYRNIIENTPVKNDQEYIDMVILNASYIPDRTAGILHHGESPLPYLLDAIKNLENTGCDLIVIPCNTSHYFYDELQNSCKVKILNMVDLTAEVLEKDGIKKVYLMATEGTIKTGVYQKYFNIRNIETIIPSDDEIAEMMRVIYEIKAGRTPDTSVLKGVAAKYYQFGCEKIILGCTEFSTDKWQTNKKDENTDYDYYIDAMKILQDKILELFGVKKR